MQGTGRTLHIAIGLVTCSQSVVTWDRSPSTVACVVLGTGPRVRCRTMNEVTIEHSISSLNGWDSSLGIQSFAHVYRGQASPALEGQSKVAQRGRGGADPTVRHTRTGIT